MILVYELVHSPYARVSSYKILCLNIHTIYQLGFRDRYRWWFIMPSGTSKFFTCRSIGSGTWVVTIYAGKVPGYIVAGDCMPFPWSRGRREGGDSPVHPLHSPMFDWGVGVRKYAT
jgi:hypothetical protein